MSNFPLQSIAIYLSYAVIYSVLSVSNCIVATSSSVISFLNIFIFIHSLASSLMEYITPMLIAPINKTAAIIINILFFKDIFPLNFNTFINNPFCCFCYYIL